MGEEALLDERQRLEALVGVWPKRQAGVVGAIGLRPVVVQKQEGIQIGQGASRKGALGQESADGVVVGRHEPEQGGGGHGAKVRSVCKWG